MSKNVPVSHNPKSMNRTNDGTKPTVEALLERIEALEAQQSIFASTPEDDAAFDREVWKAILIGAISSLFAPGRIPNFSSKAVDSHIKNALAVAEKAVETSKSYRRTMDKISKERIIEQGNDPLKSLLSNDEDEVDELDALKL
jgi:hypothetical protein